MRNGNSSNGRKTILVADDDPALRKLLQINLERSGFRTLAAMDGEEALEMAAREEPDLIILDVRMPGPSGIEVTRTLRATSDVPIIMATGEGAEVDRVVGLEVGADDYVTKPLSPRELVARVNAVLRRAAGSGPTEIDLGEIRIDLERYTVERNGVEPVRLTSKEFDLLKTLASSPGRVFTREELLRNVWGYEEETPTRTLDYHVRSLRKKIEDDPSSPRLLRTVHGVGYRFVEA